MRLIEVYLPLMAGGVHDAPESGVAASYPASVTMNGRAADV
jgi:hypothetical protein